MVVGVVVRGSKVTFMWLKFYFTYFSKDVTGICKKLSSYYQENYAATHNY